jgi:hypothetical protein
MSRWASSIWPRTAASSGRATRRSIASSPKPGRPPRTKPSTAPDFRTGRLIYNRDRNLEKEASGEKLPPCFAVTASFVQKYLKFSDGALAVTLCCHSGSPEAEAFRGALAGGNAVTIVGWDGSGNDYGARSMEYMFDRLTSANTRNPAAPHNRAFDMDDVWEYMGRTATRDIRPNLLVSPEVWERWEVPKGDAYIKRFGNGFDLSNPVIAELETDYGDKLVLHGNFGSEQGVVSVGGTELAVQTWENDKIELGLPTGKSDPAGSHGDVVVTARKRKSNRRVLTSWRGTVTYLYEDLAPEGDEGTLYNKVEIDFHMRGDAHARRTEVSGELRANTWNLALASDSTATYRAAGERRSGGHVLKSYSGQRRPVLRGPWADRLGHHLLDDRARRRAARAHGADVLPAAGPPDDADRCERQRRQAQHGVPGGAASASSTSRAPAATTCRWPMAPTFRWTPERTCWPTARRYRSRTNRSIP